MNAILHQVSINAHDQVNACLWLDYRRHSRGHQEEAIFAHRKQCVCCIQGELSSAQVERLRYWTFLDGHTTVRERARQAESAKGSRRVPYRQPASGVQQQHPGPFKEATPPRPASLDAGRQDAGAPADSQQAQERLASGAMADKPAGHSSVVPAGSQVLDTADSCTGIKSTGGRLN